MKRIVFTLCCLTILFLSACSQVDSNKATPAQPIPDPGSATAEQGTDDAYLEDFMLKVKDSSLGLMTWDNQVALEKLLGQPIAEHVEELGPGADTFQGSFIKELKYNGLELQMFSPKDNGKTFYITALNISGTQYQTARGIKVSDGVEKLKQCYPELTVRPDGRTDPKNCAYQFFKGNYYYLLFEVKDGKVSQIKIYYEAA